MNADFIKGFLDELEKIAASYADMPAAAMKTIRPGTKESKEMAAGLRRAGVKLPKQSWADRLRGLFAGRRAAKAPLSAMKVSPAKPSKPSSSGIGSALGGALGSMPSISTEKGHTVPPGSGKSSLDAVEGHTVLPKPSSKSSHSSISGEEGETGALSTGERKAIQAKADMQRLRGMWDKRKNPTISSETGKTRALTPVNKHPTISGVSGETKIGGFMYGLLDEFEKIAKKRKKKQKSRIPDVAVHGAYGGALGTLAATLGLPFVYKGMRMSSAGKPGLPRKEALSRALLRVGERAAYGIPIGAAGGWAGYNIFKRKKRKE